MLDLAMKTNTTLHPWNNKQGNYDCAGNFVPEEKSEDMSTIVWDIFAEGVEYSLREGKSIPETESLYDFVKAKAKGRFPDNEEEQELLLQMSHVWGTYIGDPIARQSLKFAWMEECCCGGGEFNHPLMVQSLMAPIQGETFVEANHKAILAEISRIPREKASIKLCERVIEVLSEERVIEDSQVVLKTEKGEILSFDEVLITLPLGYLQRNKDIFKPSLPPRLLAGIDAVSVGHLEKVSPSTSKLL